ncbi:MAG: hypothetical protein M1836_000749 [Candelina mexicana]|nr:MAG: hypothetical protein M1836_000749 [Candelina mexicana]
MDHAVRSSETNNMCSKFYLSEQYTLIVGANPSPHFVHKAILCQSPVFAKLCDSNFKEFKDKRIVLPDDDDQTFGRILSYLYSHVYTPPAEVTTDSISLALELADTYIMADKYGLSNLKALIVENFRTPEVWDATGLSIFENPVPFFMASERIYHNVPDNDTIFRAYFKEVAPGCLILSADLSVVDELCDEGVEGFSGLLGIDFLEAAIKALRSQSAPATGFGTILKARPSKKKRKSGINPGDTDQLSTSRPTNTDDEGGAAGNFRQQNCGLRNRSDEFPWIEAWSMISISLP